MHIAHLSPSNPYPLLIFSHDPEQEWRRRQRDDRWGARATTARLAARGAGAVAAQLAARGPSRSGGASGGCRPAGRAGLACGVDGTAVQEVVVRKDRTTTTGSRGRQAATGRRNAGVAIGRGRGKRLREARAATMARGGWGGEGEDKADILPVPNRADPACIQPTGSCLAMTQAIGWPGPAQLTSGHLGTGPPV